MICVIIRNKVRLMAKGFNQHEDIDFDETFSPIAYLEDIKLLLIFSYL